MTSPEAVLSDRHLLHTCLRCLINTLAVQRVAGTPPSKYSSGVLTKEDFRNPATVLLRQAQMDAQLDIVISDLISRVRLTWTVPREMQGLAIGELTQFIYLWYRQMVDLGFLRENPKQMYYPVFSESPNTARNERDEYLITHMYKYVQSFCATFNGKKDWCMSQVLFTDWTKPIDRAGIKEAGQRFRDNMREPGSGFKELRPELAN